MVVKASVMPRNPSPRSSKLGVEGTGWQSKVLSCGKTIMNYTHTAMQAHINTFQASDEVIMSQLPHSPEQGEACWRLVLKLVPQFTVKWQVD